MKILAVSLILFVLCFEANEHAWGRRVEAVQNFDSSDVKGTSQFLPEQTREEEKLVVLDDSNPNLWSMLFKIFGILFVILSFLVLILKKLQIWFNKMPDNIGVTKMPIQVVHRCFVGGKKEIVIVRVLERLHVVAWSDGGSNLLLESLTKTEDVDAFFASLKIEKTSWHGGGGWKRSFGDFFHLYLSAHKFRKKNKM